MKYSIILLALLLSQNSVLKAQKNLISLSGKVICEDSIRGALANVNIYNKNKKWGVASDSKGNFTIKMGKNDTIVFSTIQHIEQNYFITNKADFKDKNIVILMKQDTIWLNAVTVMGAKNFEEFKEEVADLNLPKYDVKLVLPIIDKYAEERSKGEGKISIKGPLTYLSHKIWNIRRREVKP